MALGEEWAVSEEERTCLRDWIADADMTAVFGDLGEAEIGHIVVDEDGPECCCGNKGCVEALCSGPGLAKLFGLLARRSPESWKSSALFSETGPEGISSVQVIRAWESGDEFATEVMCYSASRLASALGAVINLLVCLLYTSPSPRDRTRSRMPSSA